MSLFGLLSTLTGPCFQRYEDSANAEILWRLARSARDLALTGVDVSSDEKKALTYKAFEVTKRGLEADDQNWGCHKWYAIVLGDVGDYEGTKIKISNAYVIKEHLEVLNFSAFKLLHFCILDFEKRDGILGPLFITVV